MSKTKDMVIDDMQRRYDLRMQLLRQLTLDDAQDFLAARLRHDRVCLAVIYPE